jgi:uracil-DNA glycosylase family 4
MTEVIEGDAGIQRRHPLAVCERCPLNGPDYGFVPSYGPVKADIAFVGQNPGQNEIRLGKPFIGASGRLLDKVLQYYHIDRSKAFITNACLCVHKRENIKPPAAAVAACRPRLMAELKDRGVRDIVALGNVPAQSILRTKVVISNLRVGPYRENEFELPGVRIIPTFHPAACLRSASSFPSMATDIGKLVTKPPKWEAPYYTVWNTEKAALTAIAYMKKHFKRLTVDIETDLDKECLVPETKVLRRDLTWTDAGGLEVGDELVGFSADPITTMSPAIVESVGRITRQCYRVQTDRGSVVCSGLHRWPYKTRGPRGVDTKWRWGTTEDLAARFANPNSRCWGQQALPRPEYFIPFTSEPWEVNETRDGGYMAGFLDSEGCLSNPASNHPMLEFSQNVGPVADKVAQILKAHDLGNHYRGLNRLSGNPHESWSIGARWDILRTLGTFRPERLLRQAERVWHKRLNYDKARILSITPVGEREVVSLKTSTGTLIANGLLTHNSTFDHPNKYKILCIGMAWSRRHAIVFGQKACRYKSVRGALAEYLSGDGMELIFQNGKFDTAGLYAKGIRGLHVWHDTMYQSYVQDERPGIHGLKHQGVEKLGCPRWDEEIEQYLGRGKQRRYGTIPKPILYKYNAWDVAATFALDEYNMQLIRNDNYIEPVLPRADGQKWGLEQLHDFLCAAAENFMFTEYNGFAVDLKYNRELQREYRAELDRLEAIMDRTVGAINPRSPMQVKDALRQLGVQIPRKRNTKGEMAETTDAEALQIMLEREKRRPIDPRRLAGYVSNEGGTNQLGAEVVEVDPHSARPSVTFLETMLLHRKVAKLDGTYVSGLHKFLDHGRVYTTIQLHSTTTGRTSQKRPSLQVIPRGDKLRRQYKVANPDHLLGEFDYGQIELRVLTWLAQEPYFQEIFSDPSRDLFDELEPVIQPERSHRGIMSKKDRRNIVKCYVYGLAYGREAQSIADEFGLPVAEAQRGLQAFFKVIPRIVRFREEAKIQALSGRDLVTPFGRRRRFYLITDQNRKDIQNEACAFYPQSIASDICVQAFNWLRPKLKGTAWCRNTIHDALYWEFHRDNLDYVVKTVVETMQESAYSVMGDYVPIKVGADVGMNWGDLVSYEDWKGGKRPYPTTVELWRP